MKILNKTKSNSDEKVLIF